MTFSCDSSSDLVKEFFLPKSFQLRVVRQIQFELLFAGSNLVRKTPRAIKVSSVYILYRTLCDDNHLPACCA